MLRIKMTRSYACHVVTLIAFCAHLTASQYLSSDITLSEHGYENMVVAIGNDVPQDQERTLIQNLKDYFKSASAHLFEATKRRIFIRNITILVPGVWTAQPGTEYAVAGKATFDKADVIVDKPNEDYHYKGEGEYLPYVKQFRKCGEPGKNIHITPQFVLNAASAVTKHGEIGKALVHNWALLRWGVFPEYPMTWEDGMEYRETYISPEGQVEQVRCSFDLLTRTEQNCKMQDSTEEECKTKFNLNEEATASYMFEYRYPNVVTFCDSDPSNRPGYHNSEAPNKHNDMCMARSVWDIMRQHPDFKNASESIPVTTTIDTDPTFTIVQGQHDVRIVIVMDVSNSMKENDKVSKQGEAVCHFIHDTVPVGYRIGMVEFDETARILAPLTYVNNEDTRNELAKKIPLKTYAFTSIGAALMKGVEVLEANNGNPAGGILVLISDGKEAVRSSTNAQYIRDVLPEIKKKGVIVHTILYTENATEELISLAKQTGGEPYYSSGTSDSEAFDNAFKKVINGLGKSIITVIIELSSEKKDIDAGGVFEKIVYMDSTIGKDTKISVSWEKGGTQDIKMTVEDPDGQVVPDTNAAHPVCAVGKAIAGKEISYNIAGKAKPGKWKISISNEGPLKVPVVIQVESHPADAKEPILLKGYLDKQHINASEEDALVTIYAELTQNYTPIVNASVYAEVEAPNGQLETVQLFDKGADPDVSPYDGVYSGYYIPKADGYYIVKVMADNDLETAKKYQRARFREFGNDNSEQSPPIIKDVERFSRSTMVGFFLVHMNKQPQNSASMSNDILPPARITDVKVTMQQADRKALVTFTAVGDDMTVGTASSYDVRIGQNVYDMYNNFTNMVQSTHTAGLTFEIPKPSPAGSKETIIITSAYCQTRPNVTIIGSFVLGIQALDEVGNRGLVSNVVRITFRCGTKPSALEDDILPLVLGITAVAVLLTIIILIVLVFVLRRRKKKRKQADTIDIGSENESGISEVEDTPNGGVGMGFTNPNFLEASAINATNPHEGYDDVVIQNGSVNVKSHSTEKDKDELETNFQNPYINFRKDDKAPLTSNGLPGAQADRDELECDLNNSSFQYAAVVKPRKKKQEQNASTSNPIPAVPPKRLTTEEGTNNPLQPLVVELNNSFSAHNSPEALADVSEVSSPTVVGGIQVLPNSGDSFESNPNVIPMAFEWDPARRLPNSNKMNKSNQHIGVKVM